MTEISEIGSVEKSYRGNNGATISISCDDAGDEVVELYGYTMFPNGSSDRVSRTFVLGNYFNNEDKNSLLYILSNMSLLNLQNGVGRHIYTDNSEFFLYIIRHPSANLRAKFYLMSVIEYADLLDESIIDDFLASDNIDNRCLALGSWTSLFPYATSPIIREYIEKGTITSNNFRIFYSLVIWVIDKEDRPFREIYESVRKSLYQDDYYVMWEDNGGGKLFYYVLSEESLMIRVMYRENDNTIQSHLDARGKTYGGVLEATFTEAYLYERIFKKKYKSILSMRLACGFTLRCGSKTCGKMDRCYTENKTAFSQAKVDRSFVLLDVCYNLLDYNSDKLMDCVELGLITFT